MSSSRYFTIGATSEAVARLAKVAPAVRQQTIPTLRRTYYDTFDGRLYRAGTQLTSTRQGRAFRLEWRALDGTLLGSVRTDAIPTLADTLPPTEWSADLAKILGVRALAPLAQHRCNGSQLEILDQRRKIVARLEAIEGDVRKADGSSAYQPFPPLLRLVAIRGYETEADAVARDLLAAGAAPHEGGELDRIAEALDLRLGIDPSKFAPQIDPAQSAGEAVRGALEGLLAVVRLNEAGARSGLDSEYLHDLRVAVRRSRSILGQLKGLFDEKARQSLAADLRWLGQRTGPTRDLDVYRLKIDGYAVDLPAEVRRDLAPLTQLLAKKHRQEQQRLARALSSARYRRLLERWEAFVGQDENSTEEALQPVEQVAAQEVRKAHRRLLKRGRRIHAETPDEALHRLRIDGKKLRYLLELFRSLWNPEDANRAIKELKRLQDVLGDFNDLSVHRAALAEYAGDLNDPAALIATGRLVEQLAQRADEVRERFADRFAALDSKSTQKLFRRLERSGGKGA